MMARLLRIAILVTFILSARSAFAAGGACPTAANYINPSNPNGPQVTLSSLGITSCYYVAANGLEANSGTSESSPWLYAPMMPNSTHNSSTYIGPGIGIILRGGDTWHMGNNSASPYTGGTWGFNNPPGPAGTSANPIYVGVDQGWYSGSSWARPILTMDNPPNSSQTLSSCTYPTPGNVIDTSGGAFYIIDDFEMTGVCTTSANWNVIYMAYGGMSGYIYMERLYIHGWSHVGFPNPSNCTESSTCMSAFRGSVNSTAPGPPYDVFLFDILDGSDSDGVPMEGCYCGAWEVAYSYFNNISQFITRPPGGHLFHDSQILNFVDNGHANVMESTGDSAGNNANYNNVYAHLYVNSSVTSDVGFWPWPPVGTTNYWFNNLVYDAGPMEFFNIGQNGSNQGTMDIFNNTFQFNHRTDGGADAFSCSATGNTGPYASANNHYISTDVLSLSAMWASNCSGQGSDTTSLLMTNATATADNYTASQTYAYMPTSATEPTVGAGTNEQGFCSALSSAAGSDSTLSDAVLACQNDTRYACTYSSSLHVVTCPARTALGRPASKWDIGAYQYSSTQASGPNAPTNLQATVQ